MRIVLDNNGYLSQWMLGDDGGKINHENEQIISDIEDLDISTFRKEFHLYHLVDGKLVKDENRQAQLDAKRVKEKKVLSLQEKIALFVEAFEVDEQPDDIEGFEYKPYFDKSKNRFSWKPESKRH